MGHANGPPKRLHRRRIRGSSTGPHGYSLHHLRSHYETGERGEISALQRGDDGGGTDPLALLRMGKRPLCWLRLCVCVCVCLELVFERVVCSSSGDDT